MLPKAYTPSITVADVAVRQDASGRYCLNDLHRAAGAESKHQPAFWMRNAQTQALINEIANSADLQSSPVSSIEGAAGGTYVAKELVYAYAMWISPAFHLKVIRAYDALAAGALPADLDSLPAPIARQVGGIIKSVVAKQLAEAIATMLPALIEREVASRNLTVRHGMTAGEVWQRYGLPRLKNGAQWLSHKLVALGCAVDGGHCGQLGGKTARLFDPDKVEAQMKLGGLLNECKRYTEARRGQGELFKLRAI